MKVDNKVVRQNEDTSDTTDGNHCAVNIFVRYLLYLPKENDLFYCRPLPDDGSGVPRFGKQPVGRNKLAQIIFQKRVRQLASKVGKLVILERSHVQPHSITAISVISLSKSEQVTDPSRLYTSTK